MPRENRKRGKKHRPERTEQAEVEPRPVSQALKLETLESGSPFGPLDPDVKAYFRTVDEQLREWQEERPDVESDTDHNEGA